MIPQRVHLVGIGGAGLSGIARILRARGHEVSGSDQADSPVLRELEREGVRVFRGHAAGQVGGAELVLISSAIPPDNPEVAEAQRRGVPVVKRSEVLGDLIGSRRTVAVAGTHGKTTTTALIALTLMEAGLDPSFLVGGTVRGLGTNARAGGGEYFVIEADEYDRMFLALRPEVAVVTHLEWDHPDCYRSPEAMVAAFREFVMGVPEEGGFVACVDHEGVRGLLDARAGGMALGQGVSLRRARLIPYGLSPLAALRAEEIVASEGGSQFAASWLGTPVGRFEVHIPGRHNVANALAAVAVAGHLGVPWEAVRRGLARFRGVARRCERLGVARDVVVVDDYAHHPTEITATLEAVRQAYPGRKVWAVFQPHTFSRLAALAAEFAASLAGADAVVVLPVFPARERGDPVAAAQGLAREIQGKEVAFAFSVEEAARYLLGRVQPGDAVVTLSAGDGNRVGHLLLAELAGAGEAR
ncbi:MAG: UDP-N-acetylmuramate--L-alanine ligase [Anaerolineae bacterium]